MPAELVGSLMLMGVMMVGAAMVTGYVLSAPPPEEIPAINFGAAVDADGVTLHHTGGDSLAWGSYRFYVIRSGALENVTELIEDRTTWTMGQSRRLTLTGAAADVLILTYKSPSGGETILRRVMWLDWGR